MRVRVEEGCQGGGVLFLKKNELKDVIYPLKASHAVIY